MNGPLGTVAALALRCLGPERAHSAAIGLLRHVPLPEPEPDDPILAVDAFGLRFGNPVGLAAGFDKNAVVAAKAAGLGFGHCEVGTVTPRAQAGNPRPRVFRLTADRAIINRYGFNNDGQDVALSHLAQRRPGRGLVGVNIGANKDSADRVADYVAGIGQFAGAADYFTLNVSSPNTPGLRSLQSTDALDDLLARCLEARDAAREHHGRKPILLKIAPDLDRAALDDIVGVARRRGIDGLIVSNTTVSRPEGLRSPAAGETGGLSGRPLFELSTRVLAETFVRVERAFPLIGVGGIDNAATAWAKIEAGASLVQLYSGLVFVGPSLVGDVKRGCATRLRQSAKAWADVVGSSANSWIAPG